MPRIRKKTSKRQKTHERHKLQHKVREGRKKKAKAAKKNPQWKSKHKKDPGIPSEFPYKEQILAEVAEQRRLAVEERERRKNEKKVLKAARKAGNVENEESEQEGHEEEGSKKKKLNLDIGSEAVASLNAKTISADKLQRRTKIIEEEDEDGEDEEVPGLINHDLPNLKAVLGEVDVLIEMLDARDPLPYRSRQLEELVAKENKKLLLVLSKIDTCPRESLASWAAYLRTEYPTLLFRSAAAFLPSTHDQTKHKSKGKMRPRVDDGVGVEAVLELLGQWAQEKGGDKPLTVGVVGLTNVRKSSFLNTLLRRSALPVYSLTSTSNPGPSTTMLPQEVEVDASGHKIKFIDTPGLSWISGKDDALRQRDILLRSKGRIDRLKDPLPTVAHIVSRANPEDLMLLYTLPAFAKGNTTSFLSGLARSRNLVKRKGELNIDGACKIVLNDWNSGKWSRYTTAPSTESVVPTGDEALKNLYGRDEAVLATLRTRKEMRKAAGVVRLSPSEIECREVELEVPYMEEEGDESEATGEDHDEMSIDGEGEDSMEDESNGEVEGEPGAETDEDDVAEEEEYENPEPPSKKHKRGRNPGPVDHPPKKKVAFSLAPSIARQSDRAALKLKRPLRKEPVTLAAVKNTKLRSKVANAAGSKAKAKTGSGEQVYDFGKYF
ncbi:hypothetical protein JOM56_008070 [Amanita muscaria]